MITPKEQILKQVRKSLVQPLANQYPLINLDKELLKKPLYLKDEDFVKAWTDNGYSFLTCTNSYDFLNQLVQIQKQFGFSTLSTNEKKFIDLFVDNGIEYLNTDKSINTLLCSCIKIENTTQMLCFSSEIQPLLKLHHIENLILYCKSIYVENPENNLFMSDVLIKNDFRVQLEIDYFKSYKNCILFLES
ncbi:hypothetical protein [Flavobacterium filum]|jgi:hypothetical protein|uniref:hypothetical protein n=1 Tax=Flavobacterium filum TaxID=370974 RepID=UPI0023F2B2D6|nr:hypothetical protein [Flavobacterium filum]